MSQAERRTLKALGVRIGAFSLFLPAVLRDEAIACARALTPGGWRGDLSKLAPLPKPEPSARELAASGLRAVGASRFPGRGLERLDDLLRAEQKPGGVVLTEAALQTWTGRRPRARPCCAPGLHPAIRPKSERADHLEAARRGQGRGPIGQPRPDSPFAALAKLTEPPPRRKKPRRRKPPLRKPPRRERRRRRLPRRRLAVARAVLQDPVPGLQVRRGRPHPADARRRREPRRQAVAVAEGRATCWCSASAAG
jgi:ATP-dependent RNA helicase SUPV3L1/SUV3